MFPMNAFVGGPTTCEPALSAFGILPRDTARLQSTAPAKARIDAHRSHKGGGDCTRSASESTQMGAVPAAM